MHGKSCITNLYEVNACACVTIVYVCYYSMHGQPKPQYCNNRNVKIELIHACVCKFVWALA